LGKENFLQNMIRYVLPIVITSVGVFFWLWSRGGKWRVAKPREIDKMEQALNAPMAAPLLWLISAALTIYGLYSAYKISWLVVFITFFLAINLGYIFWKLMKKLKILGFDDKE